MFETAVVRARAAGRRWLPISIVVHASIVAAVVAASLTSTTLPVDAPRQMMRVFYPAPLPALGSVSTSQPRSAVAAPHPAAGQARLPVLHTIAAPSIIPVQIPTVDAGVGTQEQGGPRGLPTGTPGGIGTSDTGVGAPDASGPLIAGTGGVTSPAVIQRVEPVYPQIALRAHMGGSVVLQCVIDKTGHIRDVRVVRSSFGGFEKPAVDAVQQWLFSPGTLNGQPVDVIFELTVNFRVR